MSTIKQGNAIDILRSFDDETFDCCVTSPPYWGLRDYGTATWMGGDDPECDHRIGRDTRSGLTDFQKTKPGSFGDEAVRIGESCPRCGATRKDLQIGLEKTPEEYVARIVQVFREVKRTLKKDGTLWLNLGDSYAGSGRGRDADGTWNPGKGGSKQETNVGAITGRAVNHKSFSKKAIEAGAIGNAWVKPPPGLKAKDLVGIPWRVAFALQADGWYLRQDIIWAKPNPMPESVTDRCTKSHEYVFLLSKSQKYYFDNEAIREPLKESTVLRLSQDVENQKGSNRVPGKTNGPMKAVSVRTSGNSKTRDKEHWGVPHERERVTRYYEEIKGANKRSVWTVTTKPFRDAHFATFPEDLIIPMIKAGCRPGGTVLDPFFGAGTTGVVAEKLGRTCVGIELNGEYIKIAEKRLSQRRLL